MLVGKPNGDKPRFNNIVMRAVLPGSGVCDSIGYTGITVTTGAQSGNETFDSFGKVMLWYSRGTYGALERKTKTDGFPDGFPA